MDESNKALSLPLSLQQLVKELESLIILESQRNCNPWVSIARLTKLFYDRYGASPEIMAKNQGYNDGLRSLIKSSKCFSIYGTQMPQEFYVALFQTVVPGFELTQTSPIQYRIKRPWKVDGRLLSMLKAENAEEISPRKLQKISKHQQNLISEIRSVNQLELVLIEIIKTLTRNDPKNFVTIAAVSKKFCDCYQQPIRIVMRSVCPDMKLVHLLQTIPSLEVQKVNDDWQITIKVHSVD